MKTRPSLVCHCPAAYFGLLPIAFLSSDPLGWGICQMEDGAHSAKTLITMKEKHVFYFNACMSQKDAHFMCTQKKAECYFVCKLLAPKITPDITNNVVIITSIFSFFRCNAVCTDPSPYWFWSNAQQCGELPSSRCYDHWLPLQERRTLGKWCGWRESEEVHGEDIQTSGVTKGRAVKKICILCWDTEKAA